MTRIVSFAVAGLLLLVPAILVISWNRAAAARLVAAESASTEAPQVAVAANANEAYCTPELKQILRRVLQSCGLLQSGGGRGCQPLQAANVATMSGGDFNALFVPMRARGGIVQFDVSSAELDPMDQQLIEQLFADRGGASYFLVVARASPDGPIEGNRELSRQRAEKLLTHLEATFHDQELERQVGLLWLGEEYAQLDPSFCQWKRSGAEGACAPEDLNRSAFAAWIDCRL